MDIFSYALTNALLAGLLGLLVVVMVRPHKYPRAARVLWLLVLVKLLLPPLVPLSLPKGWRIESAEAAIASLDATTVVPTEHAQSIYNDRITLPLPALLDEPDSLVTVESIASPGIVTEGRDKSWLPLDEVGPPSSAEVPIDAGFTNANASLDASQLALVIWFAGSALWLLVVGFRVIRFERWLRRAGASSPSAKRAGSSPTPATSARLSTMIEEVAERLQLRRLPRVVVVPGSVPPLVWPIGRGGKVIVPAELIDTLSPSELRLVLAHELAHLRRRDHWVRWFEAAVTGLYWWHPVVWLARRELRTAEEIGCDQLVLRVFSPSSPATYGEALVKTSDFVTRCSRASYAMASGFVRPSPLKRRIEMIVRPATTSSRTLRFATLAAFAAALALLPLSIEFAPGQEQVQESTDQLSDGGVPVQSDANPTTIADESKVQSTPVAEPVKDSFSSRTVSDTTGAERYANARTLAEAIGICHEELRNMHRDEYINLVDEARIRQAIRNALVRHNRMVQRRMQDDPDEPALAKSREFFDRAIKPKLEAIVNKGNWPAGCHFDPIPATVDENGVRFDGLLLRLDVSTPGDTFDGGGVPVLDVKFGYVGSDYASAPSNDADHRRLRPGTESPTVRKLRAQIEAQHARWEVEKAKYERLLEAHHRKPGSVDEAEFREQHARVKLAESELHVLVLSLDEAIADAERNAPGQGGNAQLSDATDAALDAVIQRSETTDSTDMGTPPSRRAVGGPPSRLELKTGGNHIFVDEARIGRVVVNDPSVISVTPLNPTHVQITAKKAGVAQINMWNANGNVSTIDVRVVEDGRRPTGDSTSGFGSTGRGSGFGDSSGGIGASLGGLGSTTGGLRGSGASGVGSTGLSGLANRNGARASGNNEALLRLMREYVDFLQEQLKSVEAKHKAGVPGGEAQSVAHAGYQLNKARAEMFEATGDAREARQARDVAVEYAQRAFDAAQAEYAAGRVTQDRLFQAREQLLKAELEALSAPSATPPAGTAIPR